MKMVIILITFYFTTSHAMECSYVPETGAESFQQQGQDIGYLTKCQKVNKKNKCSYKKIDNPDLKKQLTEGLDQLDKLYKKNTEITLTKSSKASTATGDFMHNSKTVNRTVVSSFMSYHRETKDNRYGSEHSFLEKSKYTNVYTKIPNYKKIEATSDLHTFLNHSGSYNQENYKNLKEKMIRNYIDFKSKFNCIPIFRSRRVTLLLHSFTDSSEEVRSVLSGDYTKRSAGSEKSRQMLKGCFSTESAAKNALKSNRSLLEGHIRKTYSGAKSMERYRSCPKSPNLEVVSRGRAILVPITCSGRFSRFYKDNEWELTSQTKTKIQNDDEYKEFKKCINEKISRGFELENVSVSSSSSQLDNTNKDFPAAKTFCAKGFLGLSSARSESVKGFLKEEFDNSGDFTDVLNGSGGIKLTVNNRGSNGNGTSGECPHYIDSSGNEQTKSEFKTGGSKRAELNKAKYTKVLVTFKRKATSQGSPPKKRCYTINIKGCRSLGMKCSQHNGRNTPTWPKK